jgi:hypothetical protein
MPHYPSLKVVGWTSSYKSVQKYLNWLRKEKFDDQAANRALQCIDLLCQHMGMNPDQIVALGKKEGLDTTLSFGAALQELDWKQETVDMVVSQAVVFLAENGAW